MSTEIKNLNKTYAPPEFQQIVKLARKVTEKDVQRQKLVLMPGFQLTWYYTGGQLKPDAPYLNPRAHMNPYFTR